MSARVRSCRRFLQCLWPAFLLVAIAGAAHGGEVNASAAAQVREDPELAPVEPEAAPAKKAPSRDSLLARFEKEPVGGRVRVAPDVPAQSAWSVVGRILGYGFFLICLVVALILGFKRFLPGSRRIFSSPAMEVIGRTYLDTRRYVALVRVGERVLVLGVTQDQVSVLSEVSEAGEVAELMRMARPASESGKHVFQSLLDVTLRRKREDESRVASGGEETRLQAEMQDIHSRLRQLRSAE